MQEWSFFMINLLGLVQRKAMEVKMLGNIIFHLNSAKKWDASIRQITRLPKKVSPPDRGGES